MMQKTKISYFQFFLNPSIALLLYLVLVVINLLFEIITSNLNSLHKRDMSSCIHMSTKFNRIYAHYLALAKKTLIIELQF